MTATHTDEFLTVTEAAARYKVTADTIRAWVRKGAIPHSRIGPTRLIRLRTSDLEEAVTPEDQTS